MGAELARAPATENLRGFSSRHGHSTPHTVRLLPTPGNSATATGGVSLESAHCLPGGRLVPSRRLRLSPTGLPPGPPQTPGCPPRLCPANCTADHVPLTFCSGSANLLEQCTGLKAILLFRLPVHRRGHYRGHMEEVAPVAGKTGGNGMEPPCPLRVHHPPQHSQAACNPEPKPILLHFHGGFIT